jgi:hypothetical protein
VLTSGSVLAQQRDGGGDQGGTPFLGRHGRHPPAALTLDRVTGQGY